mmetsp:Transcript_81274/g.134298  ORF Transcript_81274/g.134298 Transcript_81274/m.134298 type:complete len:124 (+) Transcript_81274:187-558(+)
MESSASDLSFEGFMSNECRLPFRLPTLSKPRERNGKLLRKRNQIWHKVIFGQSDCSSVSPVAASPSREMHIFGAGHRWRQHENIVYGQIKPSCVSFTADIDRCSCPILNNFGPFSRFVAMCIS